MTLSRSAPMPTIEVVMSRQARSQRNERRPQTSGPIRCLMVYIGFNELRGHESHGVAKRFKLMGPSMLIGQRGKLAKNTST